MRRLLTAIFLLAFHISLLAQNENQEGTKSEDPLFALLNKVKNGAEDALRTRFTEQQLAIDTIGDEPKGHKRREIQKQKNYGENKTCVKVYNELRSSTDQLITQLKADLTMSNKKKLLKSLNDGSNDAQSWYKKKMDQIVKQHGGVKACIAGAAAAATLEELTGLFSALVGIVTSARDFRAQQIKALCEQLETLRLSPVNELLSGGGSSESKKESSEEKEEKK